MTPKQPSRVKRAAGFLFFRLIPTVLILIILWQSYGVVQAVVRRVTEQVEADQRSTVYAGTVTAISSTLVTNTPTNTASPTTTNTATATSTPTHTPSPMPTNTATNTPTTTPSPTPMATEIPLVVAQVFATNTPRSAVITLPPVNTPVPTDPALGPTATVPPTELPTLTLTPTLLATVTPRPLPTLFAPNDPAPDIAAPTAIPTIVPPVDRHGYDLVNILLMGGDDEITGDNITRTDTMIILSINRTTNTVAMLSLPRDLYVYIPDWTMQRLNLAYTHGEQIGWTDGGFGLMRQTIFYNLGINVHYYALVNLSGFKQIIDTLGGVDVSVDCAIQDKELISAPPPTQTHPSGMDGDYPLYTLPVGYYHLDGGGALWYARSRHNSSDFDRGRRQQQLLRAIWRKARDTGQLAKLPELWSQVPQIVKTNLGFEDMVGLLPIALNLDPSRIENFTFARLYHTTPWTPPDGSNVQLPNYDAIRELLEDFYQPPTTSQVVQEGAQITVYNGTTNPDWDRVAADRLGWSGFNAVSAGAADNTNYMDTRLIDHTGRTKGSSLAEIATLLNVKPENVIIQPDPNRQTDFEVILGSNYNSCTFGGVLPVEENTGG